jgi:hypothetical protein
LILESHYLFMTDWIGFGKCLDFEKVVPDKSIKSEIHPE